MAATLLWIGRAAFVGRLVIIVLITGGTVAAFQQFDMSRNWGGSLGRFDYLIPGYQRELAFASCAVGDEPVLTTSPLWSSLARGTIDAVWDDKDGKMATVVGAERWATFGTLVFPGDATDLYTLSGFPVAKWPYDVRSYSALLQRLPISVRTPGKRVYRGSDRLAVCGHQFGYEITRAPGTLAGLAPTARVPW
jgi:hypothetical protein